MTSKTKTHAQMKAKKGWLLHKPSAKTGKRKRCRQQQRRQIINMKTKDNLLTYDRNEEIIRFRGIRHFNSFIELLYNVMDCGFQRLKGLGEKLYSSTEALFPSRSHKRKYEEVTQRLDGLEDEVKRLKLELTKVNCCYHHQTLTVSHKSEVPTTSGSIAPVLPPPPPPPPPPLAPPPPVFTVVMKKQKTSTEQKLITAAKAIITLEDLLSVKLRSTSRVSSRADAAENGSLSDGRPLDNLTRVPLQQLPINQNRVIKQPVVSLKDIQSVSLRKLHVDVDAAQKVHTVSPENNVLTTMRNLRRVNVDRSPGGTPMATERQESTGTGLTPMMTRALKRKFQFANPPSSSPTSSHNNGRRKSLSPLVSSPWSPLSMR